MQAAKLDLLMRTYTLLAIASNTRQEQLGYAIKAQGCGVALLRSAIAGEEDSSKAPGQFEASSDRLKQFQANHRGSTFKRLCVDLPNSVVLRILPSLVHLTVQQCWLLGSLIGDSMLMIENPRGACMTRYFYTCMQHAMKSILSSSSKHVGWLPFAHGTYAVREM